MRSRKVLLVLKQKYHVNQFQTRIGSIEAAVQQSGKLLAHLEVYGAFRF